MKNIILFLVLVVFVVHAGNAQVASATWALTADTSVVIAGNISAPVQVLSNTPIATDTMTVKDYVGGATGGISERIWLNGTLWPTESVKNNGRFIQYSASPTVGYNLTVQSVTLNLGCSGSTSAMYGSIFCSTDSTFATSTQLYAAASLPDVRNVAFASLSFTPNVVVSEGQTFYVRIFPWFTTTPSATKYICVKNVVISGTTASLVSPSIAVFPDSLNFGQVNINMFRGIKSLSLAGSNLSPESDSIRLTAPDGFSLSLASDSGYSSSLAIPYTAGTLNATTVYAKFLPTSVAIYSGVVTIDGGSAATQNVKVIGEGVASDVVVGIFVSTLGSDTNAGTFDAPFLTIKKALTVIQPGDTVFVRGGHYIMDTVALSVSLSGSSSSHYYLMAYPYDSERPLLDYSLMPFGSSKRGILLTGNYWYIKGLDIYRAGDNGMFISGSHNTIEYCSFRENQDSGLQLGGGASDNRVINCDSYYNYDAPNSGGNADGFSPKLDVGTGNYFYGCRAWQNSDDGWDCYGAVAAVTLENCWTFNNGYIKDGSDPGGNGNGFKVGGNYTENDATLYQCLSFGNKSKGFDQNHDRGSITLINCTGYNNVGNNYAISEALNAGKTLTITNCAELGGKLSIGSFAILTTNSWPTLTATSADFVSLDTTGVRSARKADGSLPDVNFMHLAQGSQLIDAGTIIPGKSYYGSAPDIGCFESDYPTSVANENTTRIEDFKLYQNYPNPFNPSTQIQFSVAKKGQAKLVVVNILGQEVLTLFSGQAEPGKIHTVQLDASQLPSGVYFSILRSDGKQDVKKMILMK